MSAISLIDLSFNNIPFHIDTPTSDAICFSEALIVTCYPCYCVDGSEFNLICAGGNEEGNQVHDRKTKDLKQPCMCSSDGVIKSDCICSETICSCNVKIDITCKCDIDKTCLCHSKTGTLPECICSKDSLRCECYTNEVKPKCVCGKADICSCSTDGKLSPECYCAVPEPCICNISKPKSECNCHKDAKDVELGENSCLCSSDGAMRPLCPCDQPEVCLCDFSTNKIIAPICKCSPDMGCACNAGPLLPTCKCAISQACLCRSNNVADAICVCDNPNACLCQGDKGIVTTVCKCGQSYCLCHVGEERDNCPCELHPPICERKSTAICRCKKYPCRKKTTEVPIKESNHKVTSNSEVLKNTNRNISECKCHKIPCRCHDGKELEKCPCAKLPPICAKEKKAICLCPPKHGKYPCSDKLDTKPALKDEKIASSILEDKNKTDDTCKCTDLSISAKQPCRCHEGGEHQNCTCDNFPPFCEKKLHAICVCPLKHGKYPCSQKLETGPIPALEDGQVALKILNDSYNTGDTCKCTYLPTSPKQPCRCHEGGEHQDCPCDEFPPYCEKKVHAICVCPPRDGKYPCRKATDPQKPYYSFAYGSRNNIKNYDEDVLSKNENGREGIVSKTQMLVGDVVTKGKEEKICKCDQGPCQCHEGKKFETCPCEEFPPICDQDMPTVCMCPPQDGKYPCSIEPEVEKIYESCRDCSCTTGGACISIECVGDRKDRFLVQIQSDFSKEGTVRSTQLVSVVDEKLHTLEENRTERCTMGNLIRERRHTMVLSDSGYINKVTVFCGCKASSNTISHRADQTRDFLLEGANMILLRCLALKKYRGEFETKTVLMDGTVCQNKYICHGVTKGMVNGQRMSVVQVIRIIREESGIMHETRSVFTLKGYLVSNEWMECGYSLRLNPLVKVYPETDDIELIPPLRCRWREHAFLLSDYLDFKAGRIEEAESYTAEHPELRHMVADYLQVILQLHPSDVLHFTRRFFANQLEDLGLDLPYNEYFEPYEPYDDMKQGVGLF